MYPVATQPVFDSNYTCIAIRRFTYQHIHVLLKLAVIRNISIERPGKGFSLVSTHSCLAFSERASAFACHPMRLPRTSSAQCSFVLIMYQVAILP